MKTCPECQTSYPVTRVLCLRCFAILEENQYQRLIFVTLVEAFVLHFFLGKAGYKGSGLVREAFMTAFVLLVFNLIAWKVFQKLRHPQRNVLYELASFYSDRFGRAIFISGVLVIAFIALGVSSPPPPNRPPVPEWWIVFTKTRYWIILFTGL